MQRKVDETTTISRPHDLFTMPIYVRTAVHASAARFMQRATYWAH